MARSDGVGSSEKPQYDTLKGIISDLSPGDRIEVNVFVGDAEVTETYHDQVPYEETIRTVEAHVELEGPQGRQYELTAGSFSEHEQLVEARPLEGSGRKKVTQMNVVTDGAGGRPPIFGRAQGSTPPDPSLEEQSEWEIQTIPIRICSGPHAEEPVTCAATGDPVDISEQHIYVTATRDPAPHIRYSNMEFTDWVLADTEALRTWFLEQSDSDTDADTPSDGGEH